MHHRALHFSFALQTAAERAWSRCVHISQPCEPRNISLVKHYPPRSQSSKKAYLTVENKKYPPHRKLIACQAPITDIDPDDLSDEEINFVDPSGPNLSLDYFLDSTFPSTAVGPSLPIHRNSLLPSPRSKAALYHNLLYVTTHHRHAPSFPALIDYHDMHPCFQSTRSYNMLIGLAFRHACLGTAQWLLESMKITGIPPNLETLKHQVRWFVQTGRTEEASQLVTNLLYHNGNFGPFVGGKQQLPKHWKQNTMLRIWLELFRPVTGESIRCRTNSDGMRNAEARPLVSLDQQPPDGDTVTHLLQNSRPMELRVSITHEMLSGMPPGLAHHMIWVLLQAGDTSTARSLTRTYLSSLPHKIPRQWTRACLNIVHLHLVYCSFSRGLAGFYKIRRTLFDLLKLHNDIQPTSTTLLLLLTPLRRAKRCGTIAWKVLNSFKSKYGIKIMDSRVRRRVAMLANKEGRMDIVNKIWPYEQSFILARKVWKLEREVLGGRELSPYKRLLRPPQVKVFRQNRREQRGWHLLGRRISSRMMAEESNE